MTHELAKRLRDASSNPHTVDHTGLPASVVGLLAEAADELDRLSVYEGAATSAVAVEIGGETCNVKPNVAAEIKRLRNEVVMHSAVNRVASLDDALDRIARGDVPGAQDAVLRGDTAGFASALQAFAKEQLKREG